MSTIIKNTLVAVFILLYLSACSDTQQADKDSAPEATPPEPEQTYLPQAFKPSEPNYLRQRVPAEALAYIRLPQLLGYISSAKGDVFTRALVADTHRELVAPLHEKLYRALSDNNTELFKPLQALWLQHTRSPIEFIVLSNEHQQPLPRVLMSMTLGFDDLESFAEFVQHLVDQEQNLYLLNDSMIKSGHATLASGPLSIELHYDADSRRLRLLAGMGINRDMMTKGFEQLQVQQHHPMYAAESAIDSSHHGLFVWFNIERILPVAGNVMPPEQYQQIKDTLLAEARALSAGIGVSDGKGRLKLIADFNDGALSASVPTGDMDMNLDASGQPRALAALSLTTAGQLQKLEQNLLRYVPGPGHNDYQSFKQKYAEAAGVSVEETLAALGPEVLFLQDSLGEYSAIAIRDVQLYRQLLARWIAHAKLDYKKMDVNGMTIYHLRTKPWFIPAPDSSAASNNHFIELLLKARSHAYWIEEDGYLVFAAVPQLLLDRSRYKHKTRISDWLRQTQKQQSASALLLASGRIQGSPAKLYYAYLQALLFLSDIAGADIDISRLPSAMDVSLPESGTYGFQLSASEQQVFAELVYENNPAELLLGQGMGNVAVLGILAAIAIPAYQDYTIRAKVNRAYAQTLGLRRWIESYHKQHDRYPAQVDIERYSFDGILANNISAITVHPNTGHVIVTLSGHIALQGKQLGLQPHSGDDGMRWQCRGDVQIKYLPRSCR